MDMEIKDPGTGNHFTKINISHVENVNPNVKEIRSTFYVNAPGLTKEERQAAFHSKAEIGNRRNNACLNCEKRLLQKVKSGKMTIHEAITLAWIDGEEYGREHAEELKILQQ